MGHAIMTEEIDPPSWANWTAIDGNGYKRYHEEKPTPSLGRNIWRSKKRKELASPEIYDSTNWMDSLKPIKK